MESEEKKKKEVNFLFNLFFFLLNFGTSELILNVVSHEIWMSRDTP